MGVTLLLAMVTWLAKGCWYRLVGVSDDMPGFAAPLASAFEWARVGLIGWIGSRLWVVVMVGRGVVIGAVVVIFFVGRVGRWLVVVSSWVVV